MKLSKTTALAAAGVIFAPAAFMAASVQELERVCNGCGAAGAKFDFIPDRIYGTDISAACHVHDFMYARGRTIEDKDEADRVFLNNLLRIIERDAAAKWYKPRGLMRSRAKKYFKAVQVFGGPAFWAGKAV